MAIWTLITSLGSGSGTITNGHPQADSFGGTFTYVGDLDSDVIYAMCSLMQPDSDSSGAAWEEGAPSVVAAGFTPSVHVIPNCPNLDDDDFYYPIDLPDRPSSSSGGVDVGLLASCKTIVTENDEFEGSALSQSWTKTGSATEESYNDKVGSSYWFKFNPASASVGLTKAYTNTGDFSVTLCFSCPLLSDFNGVYFTIQDTTGNNLVQMQYLANSGAKIRTNQRIAGTYTFDINTVAVSNPDYPIALLHIQRSGNNWSCYYSNDGFNWTLLSTLAVTMTVADIVINVVGANATYKTMAALHWFRRDWLTI